MTNDVEEMSIQKNKSDDRMANLVVRYALPRMLKIYDIYGIRATFFFTGTFVERSPCAAIMVKEAGHEIGCHGYSHEIERGFDVLSYDDQLNDISRAKSIIEKYVGEISAFRSPALRIGRDTMRILEGLGFRTDSSIASQRFDGPFSFGCKGKMKWFFANRNPYFVDIDNPYKEGDSEILEIPLSSLLLPHIGTLMRIAPEIDAILREILFIESKMRNKPIVFLIHPNECIIENGVFKVHRRAESFISFLFGDLIRGIIKRRNLGDKAAQLLLREVLAAKNHDFEFVTCSEYRKLYMNECGTNQC